MNIVRKQIKEDLYRYYGSYHVGIIKKSRLYGYQYMKTWRKVNAYAKKKSLLFIVYAFFLMKKNQKYGFQISPYCSIGKGLYIGHFGTIVVSNSAVIGDNVNLSPNVVIGRTNRGDKKGAPHIGSKVWIGSGAVIVGNVSIGDDVMISPNSYVNMDVPSHSIVIGNPAIIHSRSDATIEYITNTVD